MYTLIRPLLFSMPPELAHSLALSALKLMPQSCFKKPKSSPLEAMGIQFSHPLGLAAGLDKNGTYLEALAKLGFSFIELGTVTPRPQTGNPKPRLFRCPEKQALINRMGFNNQGVDALLIRLKKTAYQGVLGVNIGKNKDTPLSQAVDDYLYCMRKLYAFASYITLNISSPNTEDLRHLQKKEYLEILLSRLTALQEDLRERSGKQVPLVIKVSPDEPDETLKEMTELVLKYKIQGMIATNTHAIGRGGLSGRPLFDSSTACLRLLKRYVGDAVTLIGVGGIENVQTAQKKLEAGATLLQVYTGLIYQGPHLITKICTGLQHETDH